MPTGTVSVTRTETSSSNCSTWRMSMSTSVTGHSATMTPVSIHGSASLRGRFWPRAAAWFSSAGVRLPPICPPTSMTGASATACQTAVTRSSCSMRRVTRWMPFMAAIGPRIGPVSACRNAVPPTAPGCPMTKPVRVPVRFHLEWRCRRRTRPLPRHRRSTSSIYESPRSSLRLSGPRLVMPTATAIRTPTRTSLSRSRTPARTPWSCPGGSCLMTMPLSPGDSHFRRAQFCLRVHMPPSSAAALPPSTATSSSLTMVASATG